MLAYARMMRSLWSWGEEEAFPKEAERRSLATQVGFLLGIDPPEMLALPNRSAARVRAPRIPDLGLPFTTQIAADRAALTYGRSFPEILRAFENDFSDAPDVLARPTTEEELARVLEAVSRTEAAIVPYGGGTSVVGGVWCPSDRPIVTVDMRAMDRVLEIDDVSLAARIQAGATGPRIEEQLGARGLSLRFFPQSFELSTLGGWIVTRAAGHYATGPTHIDDLVCSVRVVGPTGAWATRRLPASGAGPDPNRLICGSEGTLGFVTEAWVRIVRKPRWKTTASLSFSSVEDATEAVRTIAQSGLQPSNCRLLDDREALINAVSTEGPVLLLGFESADHELTAWMDRAIKLAVRAGGKLSERKDSCERSEHVSLSSPSSSWRSSFLRGPLIQSALVSLGLVCDTFETACTWDRMRAFRTEVIGSVREAITAAGARGEVTMRFTHAYPDGAAPYFTFVCTAGKDRIATWTAIKRAASDAVLRAGGTITHHHAVGRLHRPWYEKERPEPFGAALRAVKATLDPRGIMNPGVLH